MLKLFVLCLSILVLSSSLQSCLLIRGYITIPPFKAHQQIQYADEIYRIDVKHRGGATYSLRSQRDIETFLELYDRKDGREILGFAEPSSANDFVITLYTKKYYVIDRIGRLKKKVFGKGVLQPTWLPSSQQKYRRAKEALLSVERP